MPMVMIANRELRRVPLDFDWPINKTWQGYLYPDELVFPKCEACGGKCYSPEAWAIANTFYPHQIRADWSAASAKLADRLAWHDKLGQLEVDMLVAEGRLSVWADEHWTHPPRLAAEVNAESRRSSLDSHDGINRSLLIEFRCKQLGIEEYCPVCQGHGDIATDEQRRVADEWQGSSPPTGDGYQMWETVSEGSPQSPVFASLSELVDWLVDNNVDVAGSVLDRDEWLALLKEDALGIDIVTGAIV